MADSGSAVASLAAANWTSHDDGVPRSSCSEILGCAHVRVDYVRTAARAAATLASDDEALGIPFDGPGVLETDATVDVQRLAVARKPAGVAGRLESDGASTWLVVDSTAPPAAG